mmetsp:Transcript_1849/g.5055  ORF Transcript_1849/g.5055 Transcript_1849/m.5055 type:complete len:92 (-) Transcript_1849:135-410(-)
MMEQHGVDRIYFLVPLCIHSFIEYVLAHESLPCWMSKVTCAGSNPHDDTGNKDFAILIYQQQGEASIPLQFLNDEDNQMNTRTRQDMEATY